MYLKLKETVSLDSNAIISFTRIEKTIHVLTKYSDMPVVVTYNSIEDCEQTYINLDTHFKSKNLYKKIKVKKDTDEEIIAKNTLFENFWVSYNKKIGMHKCKEKFMRYSLSNMSKICSSAIDYVKSTPEIKYRKNPLTWLNGEYWRDEKEITKEKVKQDFDVDQLFR
jgi:hypothetical protein|tara:strand:+ start:652 stop:1152 length:501 start_codon:yes stop_codon:yes gene_type:complete